jgi:NTP pyrophosphatase (non-canonical NTP hydrolase)
MESVLGRKAIVHIPTDAAVDGSVLINGYQRAVSETDKLPLGDLETSIMGLFGEVGSLLAVLKKKRRDGAAYATYDAAILEELGDVLWYFTSIANRAGLDLAVLCQRVTRDIKDWDTVEPGFGTFGDFEAAYTDAGATQLSSQMTLLADTAGEMVRHLRLGHLASNRDAVSADLVHVLRALHATAGAADVGLQQAALGNLQKIFSLYPADRTYPPLEDAHLERNERLPRRFVMFMEEIQKDNKTYVIQKCGGVIIGDRLTDNKTEQDDYRFHDVFHIAYAVHLGWSPVLRTLFRVKRKSEPKTDENQDGARAILIEEGISTFIFGRGLERKLFDGLTRLDFDLLKMLQDFVRGFEPERCALWQWEKAVIDGFRIFRELKKHRRGYVIADLEAHTLDFREGFDTSGGFGWPLDTSSVNAAPDPT